MSSDGFLHFQCAAGAGLAILLIIGIAPVPCLALLWLFYLSLVTVGLDFLGFQWDNLLLEAGFLAIFFAPLQWLPRRLSREAPPSRLVSLAAAIAAVQAHVLVRLRETVERRPELAQSHRADVSLLHPAVADVDRPGMRTNCRSGSRNLSCATMFAIELGAPWLIFAPRRIRFLGARGHGVSANPDSADRQLHLFQLLDARALPAAAG